MEGKQLDFNAPLLSVRRFAATTPPAPPFSSSSSTSPGVDNSKKMPRKSPLPFYKSDLKSGPVRNPGVVPFMWEQSPGQPKDGAFAGDSPARPAYPPVVAPKLPPGRIPKRPPDEREESISPDALNSAKNGAIPGKSFPVSSSTSTLTILTTSTTTSSSSSTGNGTLSSRVQSSREERMGKASTKLAVEPVAEVPASREQRSSTQEEDEEEDAFSDALDTLSRTESFFMNCSVSGISGGKEAWEHSGRFFTDPQARDFMMGRFLPAAQAMATESPQWPSKKAVAVPRRDPPRGVLGNEAELRRPAIPLPSQQRPNLTSSYPRLPLQVDVGSGRSGEEEETDDDDGYDDASHLPMKGCGLLPGFCFKSSFCLMNPLPGMKMRSRVPLPAGRRLNLKLRTSDHGSVGDAEDEHSWEDVYKHKLRRERQPFGEDGSKLTSDSNRLSYWSDSQTADGSSPYRRSTTGGVSPYRNDMPPSHFREGKGFLGVPKCADRDGEDYDAFESCDKDGGEYWEITPSLDGKLALGSQSPVIERTVHVDSVRVLENTNFELSASDTKSTGGCIDRNSETGWKSRGTEASPILGVCEDNALQHEVSDGADADELQAADQSGPEQMDSTVDGGQNHALGHAQRLKAEDKGKNDNNALQALLPPPLPKSPSESWLWRTLPSVLSKNSTAQSFLGFPFQPKKQVNRQSSTDPKWETMVKTSMSNKCQVQFADVLTKSANVD